MKVKAVLTVSAILIFFTVLHVLAHFQVDAQRTDLTYRLHAASLRIPNEMLSALAGEFKGMTANYLLLEAASFLGSKQSVHASPAEWEAVARLLDQSSLLDPYFKSTYRLAQSFLPWEAHNYQDTLAILERSKRHITWDWEPGFFIGFDHYFFLNDNLTASKKLMEASEVKDAPSLIATLAARLAVQTGHTRTAIAFLSALYEKTDDEPRKKDLKERIDALKGVEVLQRAVDFFQTRYKRLPNSLEELVERAILPALPANPYGRPYTLNDGKVGF